jgi:Uma2 family endonuclease
MQTVPDEIVLPITEPETEWIRDRAVQKVMPNRRHGTVQATLAAWLAGWASGHGMVATEWRFRLAPPGEARRPLVPDVAYLSFARAAGRTADELDAPEIAPDIVIEVLSPNDDPRDVSEKIRVYRAASVTLVLVVDPIRRTVERFDADGTTSIVGEATCAVSAFPEMRLPFGSALFAKLDDGFGPDGRITAPAENA